MPPRTVCFWLPAHAECNNVRRDDLFDIAGIYVSSESFDIEFLQESINSACRGSSEVMVETGSPASTYHSMHATVLQDIFFTQVECRLELIALIQVSR